MMQKIFIAILLAFANIGVALAQIEINSADQAALEHIKGVGPAMSKAILEERKKAGNFKDWTDLERRVKGIGNANAERLSQAGLTVNGKPRSSSAPQVAGTPAPSDSRPASRK